MCFFPIDIYIIIFILGATEYPSFPTLLKQLVNPLSTQLSDRRSSIVKQVCLTSADICYILIGYQLLIRKVSSL